MCSRLHIGGCHAVCCSSVIPIRTLRCTTCGLVCDAQVHTDPMMPDARGWIDSELDSPSKSTAVAEADKAIDRAAS
jgi:hypothetical protein